MNDWLITNAHLVNEGRRFDADIRVRNGRIERIDAQIAAAANEQVFDAGGRWLFPGMIDDQVHFREPGLEHKATIASESRACVAGGITSFMEMPNTKPPAVNRDALEAKYERGRISSRANYAFYLGATNDNLEDIRTLDPKSAPGIKVFMGASTGNMLVDDPATLDAIFRDAPTPIITHCEDTPMISANEAQARERWGDDIPADQHPLIRSREACLKSTELAISLARKHGTRLHVLHVSTADELALFAPGPISGKRITAETCVHFLHFSAADYARLGHRIKCNPAIKMASDRAAIIKALAESRIDVLATDHAPHLVEEKAHPYTSAPSGLPLVQYALQVALERVFAGELTLERLVESVTHAPATLFNVQERGYLREGFHADLVIVDPARPHVVVPAEILSKCGWSPFEGETFRSSIAATFVNGMLAWNDGKLDDRVRGQRLAFDR
ncbi:MAG: dihydroorotase [Xanthomonadales bacterium]|uniref:dihydroorotase n=2 Tax=Dokdonella sp. TaxID=2291710 RepID=UPI002B9711F6|nr:dihydroorotase [Xanthomonadales bacterium]HQV71523.1 dihydroorotase [Dokdonella sp.]MBK7013323.1 dihydroorotase [Xanthomonadales bacterium]MBK7211511.1 dihydroorotase [Xanthomonadales bacterium]MBL0221323.1 dihydroorotase [Xanthomonadales bacterium]